MLCSKILQELITRRDPRESSYRIKIIEEELACEEAIEATLNGIMTTSDSVEVIMAKTGIRKLLAAAAKDYNLRGYGREYLYEG